MQQLRQLSRINISDNVRSLDINESAPNRMRQHYNFFESNASSFESNRKVNKYYWNQITEYVNYFSHEDSSVLEVGCAAGDLLNGVKGKRKVGIDFSPTLIEHASSKYPDIHFEVMDAEDISLNEKFDLIVLSNLIGYVDDIQSIFEELKKVCHENTKVIVSYYNFLWEPILRNAERLGLKMKTPQQNWLSGKDIDNLLMLAGFDVYRSSIRTILPVKIPLLSGFVNKIISNMPIIRHLGINQFSFAKPQSGVPDTENIDDKFSVSIVIPARNESGNIYNALKRMPTFGKKQEIIFVEGNSTDDTWEVIKKAQQEYKEQWDIKICKQPGKGKADAVREGYKYAEGDILMILDADLTVPPEDLPKFYEAISSGKGDFINGSRLVYTMERKAMRFLNLLGNKFFSILFSWLLDRPFKDTLCGTKVMFREDYNKLVKNRSFFGEFDPFGDYDLIFGAHKLNLKIVELPIRYRERTYGDTNISRFRHGLILLRMCAFAARKIKFI